MSNIDYKKRAIILSFICAFVIVALAMTIISLVQSLKREDYEPKEMHLYATVLETGNNYIRVNDIDTGESYLFKTKDKYDEGDLLSIEYIDDDDLTTKNIEIVAKKENLDELDINIKEEEKQTTTTITTTKVNTTTTSRINSTTTKVTKTTTKTITTKVTTTTTISSVNENEVVSFVKNEYETYSSNNSATIPEKVKSGFITIVDFIFYDGTIKGVKFKELTASAKAKVVYYALLIDGKIDEKWPSYKETIKNKYSDLKAKLIAKYMEITTSICEKHGEACEVAKNDFAILKTSLKLTWDIIRPAIQYIKDGAINLAQMLKNWYEIWSGKA